MPGNINAENPVWKGGGGEDGDKGEAVNLVGGDKKCKQEEKTNT